MNGTDGVLEAVSLVMADFRGSGAGRSALAWVGDSIGAFSFWHHHIRIYCFQDRAARGVGQGRAGQLEREAGRRSSSETRRAEHPAWGAGFRNQSIRGNSTKREPTDGKPPQAAPACPFLMISGPLSRTPVDWGMFQVRPPWGLVLI